MQTAISFPNSVSRTILSNNDWWAICCIPLITTWTYVCSYNAINWVLATVSGDHIPFFLITTIPCNPPFAEWKFTSQVILEILRLFVGFLGYWYLRRSLRRSKNNLDIIINPWSIWAFSLLPIGSIPYAGKMLYHLFGISLSPVFSEFFMLNSLSYSLFNNGWFLACSIFLIAILLQIDLIRISSNHGVRWYIMIGITVSFYLSLLFGWFLWFSSIGFMIWHYLFS